MKKKREESPRPYEKNVKLKLVLLVLAACFMFMLIAILSGDAKTVIAVLGATAGLLEVIRRM